MPPWDGRTERRRNPSDHDNLTRVMILVEGHVKNFDSHVDDDKAMAKKVEFSTKIIYIALGGLGMLQLLGILHH